MPELPEVQTTVAGLKVHIEGNKIIKPIFYRDNIRYPLNKDWIEYINARLILNVYRRAKLIVMELDSGVLVWHLGMTGSLRISNIDEDRRKHDHIVFVLDNNKILCFHDPRRFGYLKWFSSKEDMLDSISHYGVEPLSSDFHANYLFNKSRNKKQCIKNFIMNQSIVVGVGNIYACEALFLSKILPQSICSKITKERYKILVAKIKLVLIKAIEKGGTTISDFENAEAKPGYFQQSLAVYGKKGEMCLSCNTSIETIKLGGRNSFYCPKCQIY